MPFPALCAPLAAAGAELEDGERMPFAVVPDDNVMWGGRTLRVSGNAR